MSLLEEAGLGPEEPGERALAFPCRNAPVEVLLVRAEDIPEYVQDGVVDCGVTGADLVRERGASVSELLRLGFGSCTLEAAVPQESTAQTLADLGGLRIATVFPRLARELLAEREIAAAARRVTGLGRGRARLGLADAIIDLVSSGNTLRTNGLRSLGVLFSSEAVLIGAREPDEGALQLARVMKSVVDARGTRYLMMNAPESALPALCELVPGSRPPSVLPLSEPGMVAVHALVPGADVWTSCPSSSRPVHRRSCSFPSSACSHERQHWPACARRRCGRCRRGSPPTVGAVDGELARTPVIDPSRSSGSTETCRRFRSRPRARARSPERWRRSTRTRTAATPAAPSDRRLRRRRAGEHRPGGGGGRLILSLRARVLGPGVRASIAETRRIRLPDRGVLAGAEIAEEDPAVTFDCRPNNPSGALSGRPAASGR